MANSRSSWRSVRNEGTQELHAIAMKLNRDRMTGDGLSDGQEAWWDQIVADLVWRSSRKRRQYRTCRCFLCVETPDWYDHSPTP